MATKKKILPDVTYDIGESTSNPIARAAHRAVDQRKQQANKAWRGYRDAYVKKNTDASGEFIGDEWEIYNAKEKFRENASGYVSQPANVITPLLESTGRAMTSYQDKESNQMRGQVGYAGGALSARELREAKASTDRSIQTEMQAKQAFQRGEISAEEYRNWSGQATGEVAGQRDRGEVRARGLAEIAEIEAEARREEMRQQEISDFEREATFRTDESVRGQKEMFDYRQENAPPKLRELSNEEKIEINRERKALNEGFDNDQLTEEEFREQSAELDARVLDMRSRPGLYDVDEPQAEPTYEEQMAEYDDMLSRSGLPPEEQARLRKQRQYELLGAELPEEPEQERIEPETGLPEEDYNKLYSDVRKRMMKEFRDGPTADYANNVVNPVFPSPEAIRQQVRIEAYNLPEFGGGYEVGPDGKIIPQENPEVAQSAGEQQIPTVTSAQDYNALENGQQYKDPDGNVRTKGGQ